MPAVDTSVRTATAASPADEDLRSSGPARKAFLAAPLASVQCDDVHVRTLLVRTRKVVALEQVGGCSRASWELGNVRVNTRHRRAWGRSHVTYPWADAE